MQLRAELYETLTELAADPGPELDYARYRLACEIVQHIPAYTPSRFPGRPIEMEAVKTLDDLRDAIAKSQTFACVFGRYRATITELEGRDQQRLITLACTVQSLVDLRARTEDARTLERIELMLRELGSFLAAIWRVDIPLRIDLREWSMQRARNYDLLPRSWRHV